MTLQRSRRNIDMTHGSLADKILLYALPMAATSILQQLFNAADLAVVGSFVSKEAMAGVGSNTPLINLLINLVVGVALGSNVVIATLTGQGDREGVHRAVHTSLAFALLGGVFLLVLGELVSRPLLITLNVPPEVFPLALKYLRIYFAGMPVLILYNFISAIYRSQGNTRTPLLSLLFSGSLNVLLNLFAVLVLHRDVDGVAVATVASNAFSVIFLGILLYRRPGLTQFRFRELRIDPKLLKRMMRIGMPSGLQSMVFSISNLVIQSAINSLGAAVMAGASASYNLEIFAAYVRGSFGSACTTFVGQNYGAGKPDRCRKTLRICWGLAVAGTALSCGLILLLAKPVLLPLFNRDPQVIELGFLRLCYLYSAYLLYATNDVLSGYMRGLGNSLPPALLALIGICGVRLLWVRTYFAAHPTFNVLITCYPLSVVCTTLMIVLYYFAVQRRKESRLR